ncbi:MAG: LemA family protein [Ruminococcaceae bacterium]|nr:LemA family protein [Oscillospiraceae bacterium]
MSFFGLPIWAIIVIAAVLLLAIWFISTMNKLTRANLTVEEAFSGMDIQLKKRYDLIPNIVNTVKGYAEHEKETLENVIAARNTAISAPAGTAEAAAAEKELSGAISRLMAIAENYPDLKANVQFLDLQRQLSTIETDIAQSRKYYSGAVKKYNELVQLFPSSIIAGICGRKTVSFYEVGSETERENVTVQF